MVNATEPIDEPYVLNTGMPIHCIGQDDFRDEYFAQNGFPVLRFSEEQIIKNPGGCIETINTTILFLKDEINDWNISVFRDKKWDEEEAGRMAESYFRESYLKIEPMERSPINNNLEDNLPW